MTDSEKEKLFDDTLEVLRHYDVVYFRCNPSRIRPLYEELVAEMRKRGSKIRETTHLDGILKHDRSGRIQCLEQT